MFDICTYVCSTTYFSILWTNCIHTHSKSVTNMYVSVEVVCVCVSVVCVHACVFCMCIRTYTYCVGVTENTCYSTYGII